MKVSSYLVRAVWLTSLALALASCARPKFPEPEVRVFRGESGARLECMARFRATSHCVSLSWEREQTEEEPGVFTFRVFRGNLLDGSPVPEDVGAVAVDLWMPDMNHGSSPVTVQRVDVGTYRASGVWFSMPGRWQIRFFGGAGNDAVLEVSRY